MELIHQIEASLAGDKDAFGQIVSRYQGVVCATAYSVTGHRQQSEDVAQETFVTAWQRLGDLRDLNKLPAWLCGIARNMARNAARRQARDPLHAAADLDESQAAGRDDVVETPSQAERESLLWQTMAQIPEEYREPLVLFYREGHSVRAVAEALDLSEDAVKQRLSRGRKMLKGRVAAMVESTLEQTGPGMGFSAAVLGALPLLPSQVAVSGALGTAAGKGLAAKSALGGAFVTAAGVGAIGGLIGAVAGMTGGFFGMWAGIRNSPTLRVRRCMLKCCAVTYALFWAFLGYQGMTGALFWKTPIVMASLSAAGWAVYIPGLLLLIVTSNRRGERILKEDRGTLPAPGRSLEESELSLSRVWRTFVWTFALAALGSAGIVLWVYSMPWYRAIWLSAAGLAAVSHFTFVELYRKGVQMAHDEAAFEANPPAAHSRMEAYMDRDSTAEPGPRVGFYNDLAAYTGSIFGPMAALLAGSIIRGSHLITLVLTVFCLVALAIGMTLRTPRAARRWGALLSCLIMGIVSGVGYGVFWPEWGMGGYGTTFLRGYWAGAIPLALYWCVGIAAFVTLSKGTAPRK
ncbi:MAG: sigma-70 family RNA polymerase sigma factor [Candidatus Hydrogenedentes bacterium]|nr:sigma-70 family RNA polymerase sigma factor [Candidatus Hydrogenedentota bacterium]